jgi:multidrug efflux pump subunit AcrB
VAAVQVRGSADREVRVDLTPSQLDALGLPPDAIVASLRAAN